MYVTLEICFIAFPGPLVYLRGFDVSMCKFCSMHVCNLGLAHTANGGAMKLLLQSVDRAPPPTPLPLKKRIL